MQISKQILDISNVTAELVTCVVSIETRVAGTTASELCSLRRNGKQAIIQEAGGDFHCRIQQSRKNLVWCSGILRCQEGDQPLLRHVEEAEQHELSCLAARSRHVWDATKGIGLGASDQRRSERGRCCSSCPESERYRVSVLNANTILVSITLLSVVVANADSHNTRRWRHFSGKENKKPEPGAGRLPQ